MNKTTSIPLGLGPQLCRSKVRSIREEYNRSICKLPCSESKKSEILPVTPGIIKQDKKRNHAFHCNPKPFSAHPHTSLQVCHSPETSASSEPRSKGRKRVISLTNYASARYIAPPTPRPHKRRSRSQNMAAHVSLGWHILQRAKMLPTLAAHRVQWAETQG